MQHESSSALSCRCENCPGAGCTCGCQSPAMQAGEPSEPQHCACGPRCGCDAAESGCLCS